jgi:hypothetical protein
MYRLLVTASILFASLSGDRINAQYTYPHTHFWYHNPPFCTEVCYLPGPHSTCTQTTRVPSIFGGSVDPNAHFDEFDQRVGSPNCSGRRICYQPNSQSCATSLSVSESLTVTHTTSTTEQYALSASLSAENAVQGDVGYTASWSFTGSESDSGIRSKTLTVQTTTNQPQRETLVGVGCAFVWDVKVYGRKSSKQAETRRLHQCENIGDSYTQPYSDHGTILGAATVFGAVPRSAHPVFRGVLCGFHCQ